MFKGKRDDKRPLTASQHQLAAENSGLVFYAYRTLKNTGLGPDELMSACGIALVYAARTFDPAKGLFAPHYFRWAKSICDVDSHRGLIAVPRRHQGKFQFTRIGMEHVPPSPVASPEGYETKDIPFHILTRRQKGVMTAIHVEGKTKKAIAEDWKTTTNNVHTVYVNAVKRLRAEVQKKKNQP